MANIAIFYFIAQVVERILELVDWVLSFFISPKEGEQGEKRKRAKMIGMWFLAAALALGFCYFLDLNLLSRLQVKVSPFVDKLLTALVIGSGTKPIHDIIALMSRGKRDKL